MESEYEEFTSQCHNNPVLVPLHKSTDPMRDIYYSQVFDLKKRVDIWLSINVVPVEYVTLDQMFHLII